MSWASADLLAARGKLGRRWLDELSPKQRGFYDDPAKTKGALAGRRGGKTWVCSVGLYDSARTHARSLNPYICLSSVSARRIMWPVLQEQNERYAWGLKFDHHELVATLPENGSQIFCVGGDNARKVEALRGGKYGRVVIDEAASFPGDLLSYLVDDVLEAALMDLDGDLWMVGSPNAACAGAFYDLTTGENPDIAKIPTHTWTVLDNPYLAHAAEWILRLLEKKKWTKDHPTYRREYLAQWVRDLTWLVFRYSASSHLIEVVPELSRAVLGIDLGASAREPTTAFSVNGWAKHSKTVYCVHASKAAMVGVTPIAEEAKRLMERHPYITHIVVDHGGLGSGYIEEMRTRWQLPVREAQKRDKRGYIELANDALDAGQVKFLKHATRPLQDELKLLQWDEDRKEYDDRFADHCADSWLYAWRDCYGWAEKDAPPAASIPGTPEWLLEQQRKAKEQAKREAAERERKRVSKPGWWRQWARGLMPTIAKTLLAA